MGIDKSFTKVKDKEIIKSVTILNKYLINWLNTVSEIVASPNLCLLPVQQSFIEHQCILNKDNYAFLTINTGFQDHF